MSFVGKITKYSEKVAKLTFVEMDKISGKDRFNMLASGDRRSSNIKDIGTDLFTNN